MDSSSSLLVVLGSGGRSLVVSDWRSGCGNLRRRKGGMGILDWADEIGLHHHYIDTTGFKYNITLTRRVQVDQKNRMEKYTITVCLPFSILSPFPSPFSALPSLSPLSIQCTPLIKSLPSILIHHHLTLYRSSNPMLVPTPIPSAPASTVLATPRATSVSSWFQ